MSSSFDSYKIYYKTAASDTYIYYDTSSSLTPTLRSLSPNTGYYIRLIPYSNTSDFYGSTIDIYSTTLAIITNFSINNVTENNILLNWTGTYSYVKIYYGTTSMSYSNNVTSFNNSINITGLTPNTTYYFNISPFNIVDISAGYYNEIITKTLFIPIKLFQSTIFM